MYFCLLITQCETGLFIRSFLVTCLFQAVGAKITEPSKGVSNGTQIYEKNACESILLGTNVK